MSKKIKKLVSTFDLGHQLAKSMGLPDPIGDKLYGDQRALSPAEQAAAAAEKEASMAGSSMSGIPTAQDPGAMAAREDQKRRQAAAAGLSANVLTGGGGLKTQASTGLKSLLGS